jgi:hypothetical protein
MVAIICAHLSALTLSSSIQVWLQPWLGKTGWFGTRADGKVSKANCVVKNSGWAALKIRLDTLDRKGLLGLVHDLYEASEVTRRFLDARFLPAAAAIEKYRHLVEVAVFPDPLSQRPIRLRDASAAITEYRRSTGDVAGSVDLMLTFVEAGTEQAADLGYGDDPYFSALETKVAAIVKFMGELSSDERTSATARLVRVRNRAQDIGWGYGDYLSEIVARLQPPESVNIGTKNQRRAHFER